LHCYSATLFLLFFLGEKVMLRENIHKREVASPQEYPAQPMPSPSLCNTDQIYVNPVGLHLLSLSPLRQDSNSGTDIPETNSALIRKACAALCNVSPMPRKPESDDDLLFVRCSIESELNLTKGMEITEELNLMKASWAYFEARVAYQTYQFLPVSNSYPQIIETHLGLSQGSNITQSDENIAAQAFSRATQRLGSMTTAYLFVVTAITTLENRLITLPRPRVSIRHR
jgi:hypothetical protein